MAVLGACLLAADKGALCLTMSALDAVDDTTFTAMMMPKAPTVKNRTCRPVISRMVQPSLPLKMVSLRTRSVPGWASVP